MNSYIGRIHYATRLSPNIASKTQARYRTFQRTQRYFQDPFYCLATRANSTHRAVGNILDLPSGRVLGYHTSGTANGIPVLYIHGNPDSGIQVTGELEKKVAAKLGIRWIGPDRPGIGLSTSYEQKVTDYPDYIRCLVDHLGLHEYYILGTSGGTGFALACAKDLPRHQLKGVGICAGVGPVECGFESMGEAVKKAWDLWREYPAEMEAFFETEYVPLARMQDPAALRARIEKDFGSWFSVEDAKFFSKDDMLDSAVRGFRQIYAQGAQAHARGIEVNRVSWGFGLEDVKFPGVKLWYGSDDESTTPAMGQYMADRLTGSTYKEFLHKSHMTIWNELDLELMMQELLGTSK